MSKLFASKRELWSWLRWVLIAGVGLLVLYEMSVLGAQILENWHAWDYFNYVGMGQATLQGTNPYGPDRYYPYPTMMWVFVPLALLPDSFRLVWVLFPIIFLLILHKWRGLLFLLFPPLWWVISDAMFDAWLLLPFAWLLSNRPKWAGVGAVLLLFKPHVLVLPVIYMLYYWVWKRDKKNLAAFALTFGILWLPAFILDPWWVFQMLEVWRLRAAQVSLLPLMTASVWSWWLLGGIGQAIAVGLVVALGVLAWRTFKRGGNRAAILELVFLALSPIIFASNLIMVAPMLRRTREILLVIAGGWIGLAFSQLIPLFGGGFVVVPLICLWVLGMMRRNDGV